jgi:xylan 1,4-beta-xylosidase
MNEKTEYKNPIISGFAPDPSICRKGDDYYIATSSFEWFPSIPIYHSTDLVNWELITYCIQEDAGLNFSYIESAKGAWAPALRYCEEDGLFYLSFNIMHSMNARFFDVDNFVITSPSIDGPWSKPVYLHSAGFDGSMFHDEDGRKWFVSLEWETRDGYHKPGYICLCEYDAENKCIIDTPKRIFKGATNRGCIEGPHLYKHDGLYYLMCAEGGTGYGHAVTMARSKNIWGPYESDPNGPILTSTPDFDEMDSDESRKLHRYNPSVVIQKAGHGSIVETPIGEVYLTYLCARPLLPKLRCTLGRECSIQKMEWNDDGWLRKANSDDNLAQVEIDLPNLPIGSSISKTKKYDLTDGKIPLDFFAPRIFPESFTEVRDKKVIIKGQESLSSCHKASYLGKKLTGLNDYFEARMEYHPNIYQEYAGICIYYDQMDYIQLRKTFNEKMNSEVLELLQVENGDRREIKDSRIAISGKKVFLKIEVVGNKITFWYRTTGEYKQIGNSFPTDHLSDEYCKAGEFTGTTVGLFCVDAMLHKKKAIFDEITYCDMSEK